jgi:hypothetical protein
LRENMPPGRKLLHRLKLGRLAGGRTRSFAAGEESWVIGFLVTPQKGRWSGCWRKTPVAVSPLQYGSYAMCEGVGGQVSSLRDAKCECRRAEVENRACPRNWTGVGLAGYSIEKEPSHRGFSESKAIREALCARSLRPMAVLYRTGCVHSRKIVFDL